LIDRLIQRHHGLQKLREVAIFQQTAEMMGAQNFNSEPEFNQNWRFSAPNFVFFWRKFSNERNIFSQANI